MFELKSFNASAKSNISDCSLSAKILEDTQEGYLEWSLCFDADGDEYILFPACCYDGNRFDVLKKKYPPIFTPEEASVDMPVTITDVPKLSKDGSGSIQVTTGDVSVPCIGIFSESRKEAILLFTIQEIDGINLGLSYEKGRLSISYPHMRRDTAYRWPFMLPSIDKGMAFGAGTEINIPYKLMRFPCEDMSSFYRTFFENRKCMGMDDARPEILPFDQQLEIQRDKFNSMNWYEEGGFYGTNTIGADGDAWQPGWVGGGMSSYGLMKLGGELEQERALATLAHIFRTQSPSGFLYEGTTADGTISRGFLSEENADWHLLRKSADTLCFIFKHFDIMRERNIPVPAEYEEGTKRLADAFVKLWDSYGQLGQFVHLQTGELLAGGSTSCAIACAGLVIASKYFDNPRYLEVAEAAAEKYYQDDVLRGRTTGGPGEILQCPDSESAFGLLESFVILYEHTKKEKWLSYAKDMAHQCSSWVVSYNYKFPPDSEFGRHDMKTVGSVIANVQNKHSAPGICTLSGDSVFKLYKWTGDKLYLELIEDIGLTISQYMSTDARPIYSWDVPKDASLLNDDSIRAEPEKLPSGFICERVNMSDWESKRCVGGVFNGSCWAEVSNLLTLAELVPLLEEEGKCS